VESASDIVEILRFDFARELDAVPDPAPADDENGVDVDRAVVKKRKARSESEKGAERGQRRRSPLVDREGMELNPDEKQVLELLDAADKMHIDALGRELGWDSATVSRVLLLLEMRGAVRQLPGMWYLAREE
jgi:DNA processing protein